MVQGPRRLARERPVELLVGGLLLAAVLTATAGAASVVVAVLTLVGDLSASAGVATLLVLVAAVLGLGAASAALAVGLAWTLLVRVRDAIGTARRRSLWRLYRWSRAAEEETLLGRFLRPTRLFERDGFGEEPLVEELKARYVDGELDDREFERELGRLLGGGARVGREIRREVAVDRDGGGEAERITEPE